MDQCKVIARYGVGADNIDIQAATAEGILVCVVPDYCASEVATHTLLLALMVVREMKIAERGVKAGSWTQMDLPPIRDIAEMTFGVIGYGRIGRLTAKKASSLGFHVVAFDPVMAGRQQRSIRSVSFGTLLATSDIVSLHCPLTPETQHLIDAEALSLMKPGGILVNTARGGLVNEAALVAALDSGHLRGAGLDVLEVEPPSVDHPLLDRENVVVTPHMAWVSSSALIRVRRAAATQIRSVLNGLVPSDAVNANDLLGRTSSST